MTAFENPSPEAIRALLGKAKTIAVVGLSPKASRPSHQVAKAMQGFGYKIIPARPAVKEVLNERAFPCLTDIKEHIDIVDVFRAPEHVMPIVNDAIEKNVKVLWLQEGVTNEAAANKATRHGMTVIMNRCIYKDYLKLLGN